MNVTLQTMCEISKGKTPIILYGAGYFLDIYLDIFKDSGINVSAICDKDPLKIGKTIKNIEILSLSECIEKYPEFYVFITVSNPDVYDDIVNTLNEQGIDNKRIVKITDAEASRNYCAKFHINNMDDYFEKAESEASINIFWDETSHFYTMFQKLDLQNVVELACGRGRHVKKYVNQADYITLVDILDKNIEICQKRFSGYSNISYDINNGKDLAHLSSGSYTALFTYDAMVHFESIDVYNYLQETYRILTYGGRALFHHSNNTHDYKQSFGNSVSGGRSYMSAQLFAHFVHRAGLTVIQQQVIDWEYPELDCITLVEKK